MAEPAPRTLYDKIWDRHVIVARDDGPSLLAIDRHIIHEGSFHAFNDLKKRRLRPRHPEQIFGVADHYVPTHGRRAEDAPTEEIANMIRVFDANMEWGRIPHFSLADRRQGIVHIIGPEQGLTLPGLTITCSDSHTSTQGALGTIAFGIGQSESAHVMATQTLWQVKPKTFRITVTGRRAPGVEAKDIILTIIRTIGAGGATGYAVEYAGPVIQGLTLEERLTICNMSIEAGARSGMIAPDDTTFSYLHGRPYAPKGAEWDKAVTYWRTLPSDGGARFDREITIDGSAVEPTVTWGTSPEDALAISDRVPDPAAIPDAQKRGTAERALAYMGLTPGTPLTEIPIDRVFIGSCTNSRIGDLRAAAAILKGRKSQVPGIVVPGSGLVKEAAEAEGLDRIFKEAGLEWRDAGCSMCSAINGDTVGPQERCASTSNRNFVGRQGPGARTHLMSPAMAAAAAVTGRLTDVRRLVGS